MVRLWLAVGSTTAEGGFCWLLSLSFFFLVGFEIWLLIAVRLLLGCDLF